MPVVTLYKFPNTQEDSITRWFRLWVQVTQPYAHLFGSMDEFKHHYDTKIDPSRSYFYDWQGVRINDPKNEQPAMSIVGDKDEYDAEKWRFIEKSINKMRTRQICYEDNSDEKEWYGEPNVEQIAKELNLPGPGQTATKGKRVEHSDYYELSTTPDKARDWMWFQVNRPETAEPFTVLIKDYEKNGYEPAFSHLFKSQDWGIFKGDYDFLKELWQVFYPDKEYDLDAIRKKWVDKCYPADGKIPLEEPMVFRKSIADLVKVQETPLEINMEEINKRVEN